MPQTGPGMFLQSKGYFAYIAILLKLIYAKLHPNCSAVPEL